MYDQNARAAYKRQEYRMVNGIKSPPSDISEEEESSEVPVIRVACDIQENSAEDLSVHVSSDVPNGP